MLNQLSLQELISEARHHQDDLELCEYIHYWFNSIQSHGPVMGECKTIPIQQNS